MSITYTRVLPNGKTVLCYESGTVDDIRAQQENSPSMRRLRKAEESLAHTEAFLKAVEHYQKYCEMTGRQQSEAGFDVWCYENGLDAQYLRSVPMASEVLAAIASTPSDTPSDQA